MFDEVFMQRYLSYVGMFIGVVLLQIFLQVV